MVEISNEEWAAYKASKAGKNVQPAFPPCHKCGISCGLLDGDKPICEKCLYPDGMPLSEAALSGRTWGSCSEDYKAPDWDREEK